MIRLLLLILTVQFFFASLISAQEVNAGFPAAEKASNIFTSNELFSNFIKRATSQTLLKKNDKSEIKLLLADSISWSADRNRLEVRLKQASAFSDGKLIGVEDLLASMNLCGAQLRKASILHNLNFTAVVREGRIYLKIEQAATVASQIGIEDFMTFCPVISERSIEIFGKNLGEYNLVIGTGPYLLVSRNRNKEARLERIAAGLAWAKVINLRAMKDAEQGLSALRTGTLDLFYSQDTKVLEKAAQDQTLLIGSCGVYKIVYRKGLMFDCLQTSEGIYEQGSERQLDPGSIKYLNE